LEKSMKNWKKSALQGLAAILLSTGIVPQVSTLALAGEVKTIDVRQGQAMKDQGAVLLDVREPYEYQEAHVPGSVLVPLGQLKSRLQEIRALGSKPVAIICRSGRRSSIAAELLAQAGWTNVYNVQGGMIAWENAALPVVRGGK
jgi:rhodanese-related sulfurtransferase